MILVIPAAVVSCVSTEPGAHTLTDVESGDPQYTLGRRIYRTKCAKCHAPEPVKRYSRAEWNEIMPEMIEETNLNSAEVSAVWTYVLAELR